MKPFFFQTKFHLVSGMLAVAFFALASIAGAEPLTKTSPFEWPVVTRTARPWTRWWWLGNAVDKDNLKRELETYRKAGIGGVEVTCIYGVQGQDSREIPYLSPEWVAMLKHTCAEAGRLDMGVDLPPGSGWCIGGPRMPLELSNANVVITTKPLAAGQSLHVTFGSSRPQALVAYGEAGSPVQLTPLIDDKGELTWTAPAGSWTIYTVTQKFSGQKVKRPAPGGEGRVFNPFSKRSLEAGLKPFNDMLEKLSPGAIRSQFHDSYEYQGDWTENLFDEFQKRAGYDLRDHLPALMGRAMADENARVRADYRQVMGDLLLENVVAGWVDEAHAHGQLARNQAHGSPGNLLDLYAIADIPETEVFRNDQDPLVAKFASSAAHVAGRKLCSSETFTWMSEHFTETLGDMKLEADFLFASGINHLFYHGTAYSPSDAAWPGWCFYASTEMNPRNSIWHEADALNAYFTRCQSMLQQGTPDNDILIYWPVSDVWQAEGGDAKRLLKHLAVHGKFWINDLPCGKLAAQLLKRGYTFDFVSDRQLATAKTDDQHRIVMPGGKYAVVLVPQCRFMPPETMERLMDLSKNGASVIFQDQMPTDVPGFGHLEERRARLAALAKLYQRPAIGRRETNAYMEAMLASTGVVREPLTDSDGLMFIRQATNLGHQYFISNQGKTALDQWITLARPAESVVLMNPMTGRIGSGAIRKGGHGYPQVYLQLQPGESTILQTLNQKTDGPMWNYMKSDGDPIPLTGTWQVKFIEGGPALPPDFSTDKLASWTALGGEPAQKFGGTARYSLTFDAPSKGERFSLDLGKVGQSARVKLNGRDCGALLLEPYRVQIDGLHPKDNTLEIEVTNVSANRIRDMDRHGVKWRIFKDINLVNVNYKPFDASNWPLTDSGLIGPVMLQPLSVFEKPE